MNRMLRWAVNALYFLGTAIVAALSVIWLLRIPGTPPENDLRMLPVQLWESAFILLALGTGPMLGACAGFCHVHNIRDTIHPKRRALLVFLPEIICGMCLLVCIGLFIASMLTFAFHLAVSGS